MGCSTNIFVLFLFWCFTSGLCMKYTVVVMTGSNPTSSRVEIRLVGDGGRTSAHDISPWGGTFQRNSKNIFSINDISVGKIKNVELKLLFGSSWSVRKVIVVAGGVYVFSYNKEVFSGKWIQLSHACPAGFQVGPRGCEDIDECRKNPCKGPLVKCQNTIGSYRCECPRGYRVRFNERCEDINECTLPTRMCHHECENTPGSYRCKCRDGYKLVEGKCFDIDECAVGSHKCDPSTSTCSNYVGGYTCSCKPGHYRGQGNTCTKGKCSAVVVSYAVVSPPSCKDDTNYFGDVCNIKCNKGYELKDPKVNSMKCGLNQQWVKPKPECVVVRCPALKTIIAHAILVPAECATTGNFYGRDCTYICNKDYKRSGDSGSPRRTCQADKTWTAQAKPFKCTKIIRQPLIHCGPDITVDLAPGQKTANVSSKWKNPTYKGDQITLTVNPSYANEKYRYPAGDTLITWTAKNSAGSDSCTTKINVRDKEAPKVSNCPTPFVGKIVTNTTSAKVTWKEPTFTDNVGVTKVVSNFKSGDVFQLGSRNVHYTATDKALNRAYCQFRVIVKRKPCYDLEGPRYGNKTCFKVGLSHFCHVKCAAGRQVFGNPTGITNLWTCPHGTWTPTERVPDCVAATLNSDSSACTGLQVKMQIKIPSTSKTVVYCADCPTGTFSKSGKCEPCPAGQYQDIQGQSACKTCPKGTSSNGGIADVKECRAICTPGQFSPNNGMYPGCEVCPKGTYQEQPKSTACKKCPNGTSTISVATIKLKECGVKPTISSFTVQPNTILEGQDTILSCYASGVPYPYLRVSFKKNIPAAFLGKMKLEYIKNGNGKTELGIKLIITGAKKLNTGQYECKAENRFGIVLKEVTLTVKI